MDAVMTQMRSGWERLGMKFDSTISLGSVLNMLVILGGGIMFLLSYEHRMTRLEAAQEQQERHALQQDDTLRRIQDQLQGRIIPAGKANEFTTLPPAP